MAGIMEAIGIPMPIGPIGIGIMLGIEGMDIGICMAGFMGYILVR
jgi:hypothetical protein